MTSSTIDLHHAISTLTLLASRDIDNNVFNESHPHARPLGRHVGTHPPLQSSLSVPLESYYQADNTGCGVGDSAFLPTRLPAPKLAERRTQSIGDSMVQYQGVGLQEMTAKQGATVPGPARYKTELCRPYEENGTCRYGSKCQFAHGKTELRSVVRHPKYKTDLCRTFHTTGLCPYGPRCHFIHNDDERRTSDSSGEQQLRQLAAVPEIGRRSTSSIQQGLEEQRPRLQRQYSEYRPRTDSGTPVLSGNPRPGPGTDLQRRASSVADAVIRRSIGYQHQLQTLAEADQHPSGLKVNTIIRSVGSAADSFSSASSVTDSPSPSPTAGLLSPAVDDPVATTPPVRQVSAAPAGWSPESPDHARAALLAELVSRLGPHDIAAALIRALQLPGNNATAASAGALLPRGFDDGKDADSSMRQMQSDIWTQYQQQQQQQQQQRAPGTSNVCW